MADIYTATSQTEEPIAAATREVLLQITGVTTIRAKIVAWGVSLDGIDPVAAPAVVEFQLTSTAGTSTAATKTPLDPAAPAALLTVARAFTAQPTAGANLEMYNVHPQGGMLIREYPPGREPVISASATYRVAIAVTCPSAVNALAWVQWEE